MTAASRYIICRIGRFPVVIRTNRIIRIWPLESGEEPQDLSTEPFDFRFLVGGASSTPGVALAIDAAGTPGIIVADQVHGITAIGEEDFVPLPPIFAFARGLFDAACRRDLGSGHPLRLRDLDHNFGTSC
jgi:hypothetical protein